MQQPFFPTDMASIWQRIDAIDPVRYASTRNHLNGAVTYLSPYISRGVISTRQVYDALLAKGYAPRRMEKLVQELAWRDFFQLVYRHKGEIMFSDIKQPQPDVRHHGLPQALVQADTGIEAIDEAIQQLYTTGYMHNHARMYTASLACNIAGAHWQVPAAWMYYHLLDGDLASNTCSWQWVAAAFSAKKYWCNQENINKYTRSQQRGTYLDVHYDAFPLRSVPDALKKTAQVTFTTTLPQTPMPVIDRALPVLLYTHYQLDPAWHAQENANRILVLEPAHFAQHPISEQVLRFVLQLANNISGIQLWCGAVNELPLDGCDVRSKEHPAFPHFPGVRETRSWLAPEVQGYFPSFFAYWKKAELHLM